MPIRTADRISEALQSALVAYNSLEPDSTVRAPVAQRLFGVAASPHWLPRLDALARNIRPESE